MAGNPSKTTIVDKLLTFSLPSALYVVFNRMPMKSLLCSKVKKFLSIYAMGRSESIQPSRTKPKAYGPSKKREGVYILGNETPK
mgnify:CR=1 FL=1